MLTSSLPDLQFPVSGRRLFTRDRSGVARVGVKLRPVLRQASCQLTESLLLTLTIQCPFWPFALEMAKLSLEAKQKGEEEGGAGQAGKQRSCSLDLFQVEHSQIH